MRDFAGQQEARQGRPRRQAPDRVRAAIRSHPGLALADDSETIWVVDVVPGPHAAAGGGPVDEQAPEETQPAGG